MDVIDYFGTGKDAGEFSFLSNFYEHDGWTVEHHYQAAKTDDPQWVKRILRASTPAAAKKLGRKAPIRLGWDDERITVMRTLLRLKFIDPKMRVLLHSTGDAELIEGNWWGDTFWGVCKGVGENNLGKLLMEMREVLRA